MRHTARLLAVFAVGVLMLLGMAGSAAAGINQWTTNGPYGGNVSTIAVSPDYANDRTIFIGTQDGAAFKTTDGGDTWHPLSIRSSNFAVSPNYASDHTVYAVEEGVFKSTDSGETWYKVFDGWAFSVAISPGYATDQTVFFLTGYNYYCPGELYKSIDGGETWTELYDSDACQISGKFIVISPNYTEDQTVFVGGMYFPTARTTDGGTTWERLSIYEVASLAISPAYESDHTVFAEKYDSVFRSTDNGTNWELVASVVAPFVDGYPIGLDGATIAISPDYANDQTVFVNIGETGGVYKSVNKGINWVQAGYPFPLSVYRYSDAVPGTLAISPDYVNDHTLFAGEPVGFFGVLKTTDGGATWNQKNSGVNAMPVRQLVLSPNYSTDRTAYVGTEYGMFKTTDGCTNWTAVNTGITDMCISTLAVSPDYASDQTVYAGTGYSGVFKTTDGGANWAAVNNGITDLGILSLVISPNYATDQTVYAGTDGQWFNEGVFKSTDGGTNWTAVNTGIPPAYSSIPSITVSPNYASDQTVYAGTFGVGVFKSTNGGANWAAVNNGITDGFIISLAVSPNYASDQTVYACTYSGVFKTTDRGMGWSAVTNLGIISLAISPNYALDQTVYAGTWYGGVFKSTNGGVSLTAMNADIYTKWSLAVSPNYAIDHTVYAGTDYGVFCYTAYTPLSLASLAPGIPSPALTGTPITWTAIASGGSGIYQFKFMLRDPAGVWSTVKDYAIPGSTWNWTPAVAGKYQVVCYVRNAGSAAAYEAYINSGWYTVNWTPAVLASLTPGTLSPSLVNNLVLWTATASGGSGSYLFKYLLRDPAGVWSTVKDYADPGNTWSWTPTVAGKYQVVCYVRNQGSTASYESYLNSGWYTVNPLPAVLASLTPSPSSPSVVNNLVTWTATGSGGSGSYEFKFLLRNTLGVWSTVKDYTVTGNTWNWTPSITGKYQVVCYVRNQGSTAAYEGYINFGWYEVKYGKAQLASFNPFPLSPSIAGNMVTWTATGSGGSGSYEYKILLRNTLGVWTTVKDYAVPGNTWNWTPATTGKYQVVCYIRNQGSTVAYDSYINSGWYTVK